MAASLGQVYKGRLKENGDLVAVKVQRPFVLETVTVDLFVIRNLGLVLRKFPQVYNIAVTTLLFCQTFPSYKGASIFCSYILIISHALPICFPLFIPGLYRCGWIG